ncbi:hypothetical protein [Bradyrhizobium elkanii]|uniref:hypothetical protein n=1 Tax=Bradyrhizobium elkanii TaxID=29448 RepID=UPI003514D078
MESYVNPNAHCPVCGCPVFFYRSPYNGRVFFDWLGWPWPKHGCTDNRGEPQLTTRQLTDGHAPQDPAWRKEGWSALLSPRVSSAVERSAIRGDCATGFVDPVLPRGTKIDRDTPILLRTILPDLHEATFLASDHSSTIPVAAAPFDRRLAQLDDSVLTLATKLDAAALCAVGRFLLWDLDDPISARQYQEAALERGDLDAAFDLMVLARWAPEFVKTATDAVQPNLQRIRRDGPNRRMLDLGVF